MNENLISLIMLYTTLMDSIYESSFKINSAAKLDNLNFVINESENRERLIKIFEYIQNKIESIITNRPSLDDTEKEILTTWSQEVSNWYQKTTLFDKETASVLETKKEALTKEIAIIFKNKEQHKGYSLSSVKK